MGSNPASSTQWNLRVADEAVLNNVHKKKSKKLPFIVGGSYARCKILEAVGFFKLFSNSYSTAFENTARSHILFII
jgi:hypothetical protein